MKIKEKIIDDIVLQFSTRGMKKIQEKYYENYIKIAAENLLKVKKGNVFLYTGFYVNGYAETDGPLGTYFLAQALNKLGYTSIIVSDEYCKDFFKEINTIYLNHEMCEMSYIENLLTKYNPLCHIAIERCGKNKHNTYINSRGEDISKFTPAIDLLFEKGSQNRPSFAIGDGGNEVGMGNFKDFIKNDLKVEPSIVEADFLIIASVSNWGAYALIAYLEKIQDLELLPEYENVNEYLKYILRLGAVDGMTRKNEHSVDGKEWQLEKQILKELKNFTHI